MEGAMENLDMEGSYGRRKAGKTREAEVMEGAVKGAKQGKGIMEEVIKELRKKDMEGCYGRRKQERQGRLRSWKWR